MNSESWTSSQRQILMETMGENEKDRKQTSSTYDIALSFFILAVQ